MVFKLIVALLLVCLGRTTAEAKSGYFTTKSVLKEFFPSSDRVSFVRFTPQRSLRDVIAKRLGYTLARKSYVFYVAKTGNRTDGYAFIDNEQGQHLPITFAVKLSTKGIVLRQEIMVYRESRGDEVRNPRFRKQFVGKGASDSIRIGTDIDSISGATISSRAISKGVKRSVVLFGEAVMRPQSLVSSTR